MPLSACNNTFFDEPGATLGTELWFSCDSHPRRAAPHRPFGVRAVRGRRADVGRRHDGQNGRAGFLSEDAGGIRQRGSIRKTEGVLPGGLGFIHGIV